MAQFLRAKSNNSVNDLTSTKILRENEQEYRKILKKITEKLIITRDFLNNVNLIRFSLL